MARSRSLPSTLFDDPDFFELSSDEQVILVGLVLTADDHGRGLAHKGLLSRKFNKSPEVIEKALTMLEQQHLLVCYQDEQQRCYYALSRWNEWETLSKPARSKYPAPPEQTEQNPQNSPGKVGGFLGNFGKGKKVNWEDEDEDEDEDEIEKEDEEEDEGERKLESPTNITPFPNTSISGDVDRSEDEMIKQVAAVLKLPVTDALTRIVTDFAPQQASIGFSLVGEADAAREWIDDARRNHQRKHMTPAFFRRWLEREQAERRKTAQSTGSRDQLASPSSAVSPPSRSAGRSLMDLEAEYQAEQQRARTEGAR